MQIFLILFVQSLGYFSAGFLPLAVFAGSQFFVWLIIVYFMFSNVISNGFSATNKIPESQNFTICGAQYKQRWVFIISMTWPLYIGILVARNLQTCLEESNLFLCVVWSTKSQRSRQHKFWRSRISNTWPSNPNQNMLCSKSDKHMLESHHHTLMPS